MDPHDGHRRRGASRRRSRRARADGDADPTTALDADAAPANDDAPGADAAGGTDAERVSGTQTGTGTGVEPIEVADPTAVALTGYQQLIDHTATGMLVVDGDARVLLHNPAAEDLLGTHHLDLAASRFQHPITDEAYEIVRLDPDGSPRTLQIECSPFAGLDEPAWLVSIRPAGAPVAEAGDVEPVGASTHDALTGLPGRELFLNQVFERVRHRGGEDDDRFAVVVVDLEHFVEVNDRHGRAAGDRVLQAVAARLTSSIRPGDYVSRLGDDDFAIVLAPQPLPAHLAVTDRIDEVLAQPVVVDGAEIYVAWVLGIAVHADTDDEIGILDRATEAMVASSSGSARLAPRPSEAGPSRAGPGGVTGAVARAVAEGQIFLQYQPIIAIADNSIAGLEALVRWEHPDDGIITPDEFLRVAEERGGTVALGDWVISDACEQIAAWRDELPDYLVPPVSINISPRQAATPELRRHALAELARHGLGAESIRFEIAEDVLLDRDPRVESLLRALVDDGIGLVLDGFGTGMSSLTHLQVVPLAGLKIDRSFVARLMEDGPCAQLVLAAVGAGQAFDVPVTAMGVESNDQKVGLARWGCELAQGTHLARAMNPVEATRFFARDPASLRVRPSGPLLRSSGSFAQPLV